MTNSFPTRRFSDLQIQLLEQHIHNFNNLEHSRNIQDLAGLIKYIFNKDLPPQFYTSADYYSSALSMSLERQIGRAQVCTPVTNAHLVCRLLLDKKSYIINK